MGFNGVICDGVDDINVSNIDDRCWLKLPIDMGALTELKPIHG